MDIQPTWSLGTDALRGAARWSDVFLPPRLWGTYARAAAEAPNPSEIYIALAIASGVEGAIESFERMYFGAIMHALRREGATAEELVGVRRKLRVQLLAWREGNPPLITVHAGRGELAVLLATIASQAFVAMRRG